MGGAPTATNASAVPMAQIAAPSSQLILGHNPSVLIRILEILRNFVAETQVSLLSTTAKLLYGLDDTNR